MFVPSSIKMRLRGALVFLCYVHKGKVCSLQRDAAVVNFKDGYLIHTCDSAGGIGELEHDSLNVPIETVALFTFRTALMENISLGAMPLSASVSFSNSPRYVQSAINALKSFADFNVRGVQFVFSMEKNFKTSQTGIGVGIVGFTKKLKISGAKSGDAVYIIGMPKVGKEVLESEEEIVSVKEMFELIDCRDVGEIIPVGSKGILEEAKLLAKNSNLSLVIEKNEDWLFKSAGPATCAVFWAKKAPNFKKNIQRIGYLR